MIGCRCKNCIWWDNQHISVKFIPKIEWKPDPGFCRKHKPGANRVGTVYVGVQPVQDANEFCGEFRPEDK